MNYFLSDSLWWVLVFGAIFVFGAVVWLIAWQGNKSKANLRELAGQLGLEFVPAKGWLGESARAVGVRRGKPVELFTYSTGSSKARQHWVAVSARPLRTGGWEFTLSQRNFFTRVGEWFGRRGVGTGDAVFDKIWLARSNRPELFAAALLPELRAKLMAAQGPARVANGTFTLKVGVVKYAELGCFSSNALCARIPALVDIVCDMADAAEVAPGNLNAQRKA